SNPTAGMVVSSRRPLSCAARAYARWFQVRDASRALPEMRGDSLEPVRRVVRAPARRALPGVRRRDRRGAAAAGHVGAPPAGGAARPWLVPDARRDVAALLARLGLGRRRVAVGRRG